MLSNFRSKYRVHGKIGEGSFSEVLKCQDRVSGTYIAAKQLKKTFRSACHATEIPELVAMRKLRKHENILNLLESHYDPQSGKVILVFELMDMSLYDLMKNWKRARNAPIPEYKAKSFLYQIVKGVDHIHENGIFHRDIKPENILVKVSPQGETLKVSDFGSIKGTYSNHPFTEYISTRWYRSPECLLTSGYYGPKMDVWAIGCVFFELLTLKPLFPGSNELDQVTKINQILGAPSARLLTKLRKMKGRNIPVCFPAKRGTGLNPLLPTLSPLGRDIMKQMITYDPDQRINMRRLLDHKYFGDLKEDELLKRRLSLSVLQNVPPQRRQWKNPALLSYLTSGYRSRTKKRPQAGKEKENVPAKIHATNPRIASLPIIKEDPPRQNRTAIGDSKPRAREPSQIKNRLVGCTSTLQTCTVSRNTSSMAPKLDIIKSRLHAQSQLSKMIKPELTRQGIPLRVSREKSRSEMIPGASQPTLSRIESSTRLGRLNVQIPIQMKGRGRMSSFQLGPKAPHAGDGSTSKVISSNERKVMPQGKQLIQVPRQLQQTLITRNHPLVVRQNHKKAGGGGLPPLEPC